ncbi:hypothetical protein [Streptomyces sp. NPDC002402]
MTTSEGPDLNFGQRETKTPGTPPEELSWPDDGGVKIALWAPTQAGKTTFLWALLLASLRTELKGNWLIDARDEESRRLKQAVIDAMTSGRSLPTATVNPGQPTSWTVFGTPEPGRRRPRDIPASLLRPRSKAEQSMQFTLHLQDLPGSIFDFRTPSPHRPSVARQLARADAFVYLHNPLIDRDDQEEQTMGFFQHMLDEVVGRSEGLVGGRLPQHVAVCITKFDHQHVYEPALDGHFVIPAADFPHTPTISEANAHAYFNWLCQHHAHDKASDLVRASLERRFHQRRVRYYATSAIGFHREKDKPFGRRVNNGDLFRYDSEGKRVRGIDGPVFPVNVLEPVIDLSLAVLRGRDTPGRR